jgi:hypothetical protein
MKLRPGVWVFVAAVLLLLRLAITIRSGAVSGDDMQLLADCFGWWHNGNAAGLVAAGSTAGILYSNFHNFGWAVLAGIGSFRLAPLFVVHAVMMTLPALLLGWQLRGRPEARWAVLLALSSPLAAYFSLSLLPLWWMALFGGTVALQVATMEERGWRMGTCGLLLVGLVSGYLCGVYPSLSPLALGLFIWLLLKRRTLREYGAYLAGCVVGLVPFICLLVSRWDQLTPRVQVGKGALSWLHLLGGIFRYIGTAPVQFMNSQAPWTRLEQGFHTTTVALWLVLFAGWMFAMIRTQRAHRALPGGVLLAACSFAAFIPFTLITRTESWYHQVGNLWWISALVVPWTINELAPRLARGVLTAIVGFNVAGLLVVFGPRLMPGTTTEDGYSNHGRGPSWWMQEQIVEQISTRARQELAIGVHAPIAVKTDRIYFIFASLPNLFHVQHPDLDDKVKWVAEGLRRYDLLVTRDRAQPSRLRLADWPDTWLRPQQTERNAIHVVSRLSLDRAVQVSLELPDAWQDSLEIIDSDGHAIPFCREPGADTKANTLFWIRLPQLRQGVSVLWVYHGGHRESLQGESPPDAVFDFFEGFDGNLSRWETIGRADWQVANGVCQLTLPDTQEDNTSAMLLIRNFEAKEGILEARMRFLQLPAKIDAGIVFAARRGEQAYLWNLNGNNATVLSQLDANGTPTTLGSSNWYWNPKAGRWAVIGAQWAGPLIRVWVDGETVLDTINLDETGAGRVGLGAKRGSGTCVIEYDWVRLRTAFMNSPPEVTVEPGERSR